MTKPDIYRIRWARIFVGRGQQGRRCLIERKIRLFGIPLFWFPVDGAWRAPLPITRVIEGRE